MKILLVEDDIECRNYLDTFLQQIDHSVIAVENGRQALDCFKAQLFDLVITDIRMPKMSGIDLLRKISLYKTERDFDVLIFTGYGNMETAIAALRMGACNYLLKPVSVKLLLSVIKRLEIDQATRRRKQETFNDKEKSNFLKTLELTVNALDLRDNCTFRHSQKVSLWCEKICEDLQVNAEFKDAVCSAAKLHDIGKIGVADSILGKPGRLTPKEYEIIKLHPVSGSNLLNNHDAFRPLALMVRHHHERFDGNGYPDGLKGEEIPLGARIISVADSFDAMFTDRPYRRALAREVAIQNIVKNSGILYDPIVVKGFLNIINAEFIEEKLIKVGVN